MPKHTSAVHRQFAAKGHAPSRVSLVWPPLHPARESAPASCRGPATTPVDGPQPEANRTFHLAYIKPVSPFVGLHAPSTTCSASTGCDCLAAHAGVSSMSDVSARPPLGAARYSRSWQPPTLYLGPTPRLERFKHVVDFTPRTEEPPRKLKSFLR